MSEKERGFTLIEMIVVIGIIAIIIPFTSSLIIQAYNSYSDVLLTNKLANNADYAIRTVTNDLRSVNEIIEVASDRILLRNMNGDRRYYRFTAEGILQLCRDDARDAADECDPTAPGHDASAFGDLLKNNLVDDIGTADVIEGSRFIYYRNYSETINEDELSRESHIEFIEVRLELFSSGISFPLFSRISHSSQATGSFTVETTSFAEGGAMPLIMSCSSAMNPDHAGSSRSPEISWSNLPAGTTHLSIIMDDEGFGPGGPTDAWIHWGVYGIDVSSTSGLAAGASPVERVEYTGNNTGGTLGTNDWRLKTYIGPCPPRGSGTHSYRLTVYALNQAIVAGNNTRAEFRVANASSILGSATLTGTFAL